MNACQSCLKLKLYRDAKDIADEVLNMNPLNVKMLYRKGKALIHLGEYHEAIKVLVDAAKVYPNEKIIRDKIEKAKKLLKEYEEKEKEMYKDKLRIP